MLDPDYLDAAGDLVGGVYSQIEAELLDHLVSILLDGGPLDQMGYTALAMLAQTHTQELQAIVDAHQGDIDEAVAATVEEYLGAADVEDMARAGGEALWPKQVDATVAGISTVLARDNIKMVDSAKTAFLTASTQAVTRVNTGVMTADKALHSAVRQLEADGISIISYKDGNGNVTVRNKVDVAVRRHTRTQIAQDAGRMTETRMEEQGIDLVEVSSHSGARPSHAEWQGRCYSRTGRKVIDGTVYPDFDEATGYHGTGPHGALGDRLLGVNCRHSFGPYRHGAPHAYEPDPKSETGLSNDEVYALTQRQRAKERQIRSAKRELRGAQQEYEKDKSTESLTAVNAAKSKLRKRQSEMRSLIDTSNARCRPGTTVLHRNPRREWAGDMPDVKTAARTGGANRKIYIGKSLGARARNFEVGMPGNEKSKFVEGSEIEEKCIFAGKDAETGNELKKRFKLAAEYGGNPEDWSHVSGNGWLYDPALNGKIRLAEVHWMQNTEIDEYQEFWFKKWIDDD